ncbi:ROK family protein [Paenibacillus sp. NPDC058177]|uniref:ROK family transcriptional regulator n=1 Tax=Paenibacillus sp. NPDC058177 TaxID=3346369 RepID=UPI0036DA40D7
MNELLTNAKDMKKAILQRIRTHLLHIENATKAEISESLGLSFPTVSKFLKLMEEDGEVFPAGVDRSSGGRRAMRYQYNPDYKLGLAIFLEKNATNYAVYNCLGQLKEQGTMASLLSADVTNAAKTIENLIKKHPKLGSIAVGVPGSVKNGEIIYIPNYEQFRTVDLKHDFEQQFAIPVIVENDMNAAVLGYTRKNNLSNKVTIVYLYLGQNGPGAGIVVNGEVIRGSSFFSGEIQFTPLYDHLNFGEALEKRDSGTSDRATADKQKTVDVISRMVATFAVMLNPNAIIFNADEIDRSMLLQIRTKSAEYVPEEHLPELIVSDWIQDYLYGLQSLGLNLIVSETTIPE